MIEISMKSDALTPPTETVSGSWHWLRRCRRCDAGRDTLTPFRWTGSSWEVGLMAMTPEAAFAKGWRYIAACDRPSPVAPPAVASDAAFDLHFMGCTAD